LSLTQRTRRYSETNLSKGAVSKAIKGLLLKEFIRTHNDDGIRRYLIRDPRMAMAKLREMGEMTAQDFEDANYLLEQLKQELVKEPKRARLKKTPASK
jgi:hypothetical protein